MAKQDAWSVKNQEFLNLVKSTPNARIKREASGQQLEALQWFFKMKHPALYEPLPAEAKKLFILNVTSAIALHNRNNKTAIILTPWGQKTASQIIKEFDLYIFCD